MNEDEAMNGDEARGGKSQNPFGGFAQLSQLAQLASQLDAQGLVAGVGQAMSWAREAVVAPHALHQDPTQHPECVICKGMTVVQGAAQQGAPASEPPAEVRWIPVTRIVRS